MKGFHVDLEAKVGKNTLLPFPKPYLAHLFHKIAW